MNVKIWNDFKNYFYLNINNNDCYKEDVLYGFISESTDRYLKIIDTSNNEEEYIKLSPDCALKKIHFNDFNEDKYLIYNLDLKNKDKDYLYNHYTNFGIFEKRLYDGYKVEDCRILQIESKLPSDFQADEYKELNKDLNKFDELELKHHYITHGFYEKRKYKNDLIDNDYYNFYIKNQENNFDEIIESWDIKPKISILLTCYKSNLSHLKECLDSVLCQVYDNWELCVYDDGSCQEELTNFLRDYEKRDNRIKIKIGTENKHMSFALNTCLDMSSGDFCSILDHDDMLAKDCLFYIAAEIIENPEIDWIYYDHIFIKEDGKLKSISKKCRPDPILNITIPYMSTHATFRRKLIKQIGGFRLGLEGSQDHDLGLRLLEIIPIEKIKQIPLPLYLWREGPTSTAGNAGQKPYAYKSGEISIREFYKRKYKTEVSVKKMSKCGGYQVDFFDLKKQPSVEIIIQTHKRKDLLEKCLESIFKKTDYKNFTITVVCNNATPEIIEYLNSISKINLNFRFYEYNIPFNWSKQNNYAAGKSNSEFVLFLNDDIEVVKENWLKEMMFVSQMENVGTVGAKLLYADNTIQHIGIGFDEINPFHPFKNLSDSTIIRKFLLYNNHCFYGNTGACLLVSKEIFNKFKGFNEKLPAGFNDVDFCFRVEEEKLLNVCCVKAELIHHEHSSRKIDFKQRTSTEARLYIKSHFHNHENTDESRGFYNLVAKYWKNPKTYKKDNNNLIGFVHIPKTAGCSIRQSLIDQYGVTRVGVLDGKDILLTYDNNIGAIQKIQKRILKNKIIMSHFSFGIHELLNRDIKYITFLRNPIDRVISHYMQIKNIFPNLGSIDDCLDNNIICSNLMTKQLAGKPPEEISYSEIENSSKCYNLGLVGFRFPKEFWLDKELSLNAIKDDEILLKTALMNIEKYFIFVGIQEKIQEHAILLFKHLGIDINLKIPFINESLSKIEINRKTREKIIEKNQLDLSLYQQMIGGIF